MILAINYFFDIINKWKNNENIENENKFEFLKLLNLKKNNIKFRNSKNYSILARYLIAGNKTNKNLIYVKTDNIRVNLIINKFKSENNYNLIEVDLNNNIVKLIETVFQSSIIILPEGKLSDLLSHYTSGSLIFFQDNKFGSISEEKVVNFERNIRLDHHFYQSIYNLDSFGFNDLKKYFNNEGILKNHLISKELFYLEYNKFVELDNNEIKQIWDLLETNYWIKLNSVDFIKNYFDKIYLMKGDKYVKIKNYLYKNKLFYSEINDFNKIIEDALKNNFENIIIFFDDYSFDKKYISEILQLTGKKIILNKNKNKINQMFLNKKIFLDLYWKKYKITI